MCGLVGIVGSINATENKVFRDLLRLDVIRGPHSTGIAAQKRYNHETAIVKKAMLPDELFDLKATSKVFNDYGTTRILLGHNRWATQGAINHVNAHPFEMDTIIGAHNGTLRNQTLLPDHHDFDVDSENIFHSFEKIGVRDTVKKLHGAYALTWFEKDDDRMNFLRNEERTLYYCFKDNNKTFFYASEKWMLEVALSRHGLKHQGILAFEPHFHYKLEIPALEKDEFENFYMTKVEAYVPPKQNLPATTNSNYWKGNPSTERKKSSGGNTSGAGTVENLENRRQTKNGGETSDTGKCSSGGGDLYDTKYHDGDLITFRIPFGDKMAERYIVGRDVWNSERKIRVCLPQGAVIRKEMLEDPSEWWCGIVNGRDKEGRYIVQGNSVRSYDEIEDEEYQKAEQERANRELKERYTQEDDEAWEKHVGIIAGAGSCAWCTDPLDPMHDNLIVNNQTVFCPSCKQLKEVREFLPEHILEQLKQEEDIPF